MPGTFDDERAVMMCRVSTDNGAVVPDFRSCRPTSDMIGLAARCDAGTTCNMTDQLPPAPATSTDRDAPLSRSDVVVVGVKIRDQGEGKIARTADPGLKIGDYVVLELENDLTYGRVSAPPRSQPFSPPMRVMQSVLRKATEADEAAIAHQQALSLSGGAFCRERASALGLQMKLVEVYGSLRRRTTLTFSYTAESRVDFRQLVRDLARRFNCRIAMRQISSREEARRLSGVDTCGLVLCCAGFLADFKPVMLTLSQRETAPSGDSHRIGVCGRVKCCLVFESDDWPAPRSSGQQLIHPTRS